MKWSARARTYEEQRRWSRTVSAIRGGGWATLLLGFIVMAGTGAVLLLIPTHPVFKGVVAGVLFASAFWAPFTVLTVATYSATTGAWGESFTKDLLKRHAPSWPVVHDVPMKGYNIDHVVVSPRAVLAIETKYLGGTGGGGPDAVPRRFIDQARQSARATRLLLRSTGIGLDLRVDPVLMLWGPGAPVREAWTQIDEVVVVSGPQGHRFLKDWSSGAISADEGQALKAGLERHQQMRRTHERNRAPRPKP